MMNRHLLAWLAISVAGLALVTATGRESSAPQPVGPRSVEFALTDLGLPPTSSFFGSGPGAIAINESGEILVRDYWGDQDGVWHDGHLQLFSESTGFEPTDINDRGEVAGFATGPVTWEDGTLRRLQNPSEGIADATAINNFGTVIGTIWNSNHTYAYAWFEDVPTALRPLPGATDARPTVINDAGLIVGTSWWGAPWLSTYERWPTAWRNGAPEAIPLPDGASDGEAVDVNELGHVLLEVVLADGRYRPAIWDGTVTSLLPAIDTTLDVFATAMNDSDVVVGQALVTVHGAWHAVTWQNAKLRDLNAMIDADSDLFLTSANDVNNSGLIIASGSSAGDDGYDFLLEPLSPDTRM